MMLNLWERLGVVLTMLWLVIAPVWITGSIQADQIKNAERWLDDCRHFHFESYSTCMDMFGQQIKFDWLGCWREFALAAVIAAAFVWALAYAATYSVRWIMAGRNSTRDTTLPL